MKKRYLSLVLAVAMACYSGLPAYAEASEAFSEQGVAPEVVNVLEDVPTDTSIDASTDAILLDEDESNPLEESSLPEPEATPEPEFTPEVPEEAEIPAEPEATNEPEYSSELRVLPDETNTASEPELSIDSDTSVADEDEFAFIEPECVQELHWSDRSQFAFRPD